MNISYRTAAKEDAKTIARIFNIAYDSHTKRKWRCEPDILKNRVTDYTKILKRMEDVGIRYELVLDDKEVVGFSCLWNKSPGVCILSSLTILPSHLGTGLGKGLLRHSEDVCTNWGCQFVVVEVLDCLPDLIEFYRKNMYHKTGNIVAFPKDDPDYEKYSKQNLKLVGLYRTLY